MTNFKATLAPPHSDLAQQTLKGPYIFDFLTLGPDAQERDLERGLLEHVRDFLLELGSLPTVEELEAELGGTMRPRDG